jgi:hypothetical protein
MKKELLLGLLSLAVLMGPANAGLRTSKTVFHGSLVSFDPIPGTIAPDEIAELSKFVKSYVTGDGSIKVDVGRTIAWNKVERDGYVICTVVTPKPELKIATWVEAIVLSTGAFPGLMDYQNVYDEEAYNLVGCNTPSPTVIIP